MLFKESLTVVNYKGRPLIKPMMVVASGGCIIDTFGPYLSDGKNNDTSILNKQRKIVFQNDLTKMTFYS